LSDWVLTVGRQSRDDADHNLVTVVMNEKGLSLQETYDWIGRYHDDVADEFLRLYKDLPSFPDESEQVNREIREYVYGLGNWVRTNERWSFEVSCRLMPEPHHDADMGDSLVDTLGAMGRRSLRTG